MKINFRKILVSREIFLLILIIAKYIFMFFKTDEFFTLQNIRAMTLIISINSIIAAAMTILFISGGFDLSTGSVMATIGVVLGILLNRGVNFILAILLSLALGTIIGIGIGLLITKGGINPFIVTLGAMFIFRGAAWVIAKSALENKKGTFVPTFTDFPGSFLKIAGGKLFGIEIGFYYMLVILIIFGLLISKNIFFRQNYYIGGNESASKLLGMKIDRIKIVNYALVALMVSVATIIRASRVEATTATTGETLGLEVVAAVIIGGASLRGGEGSIIGSFLGIVLLTLIFNIIIVLGKNPVYYEFSVGIILLASATLNDYIKKVSQRQILQKSI